MYTAIHELHGDHAGNGAAWRSVYLYMQHVLGSHGCHAGQGAGERSVNQYMHELDNHDDRVLAVEQMGGRV